MSFYILTLSLKTEKFQEHILNKHYEKYRKIYNACIEELYKRYNHMRESKEYQRNCKSDRIDRNKVFYELDKRFGLTEYSLHYFTKPMAKYFNVNAMITQVIHKRAFKSFRLLMLHKAKKIKYKSYGELNSIEGKTSKKSIIFRDDNILFAGLKIPVIIKKIDYYSRISLNDKIKYCRIKREVIKGKYHYYAQFIIEGVPPIRIDKTTGEIKNYVNDGVVGLDIGTQSLGICSKTEVKLLELCPEVQDIEKQKRILQRKMDRSRRSTNPDKYNDNGTYKNKNNIKWIKSKHYIKTQNELKELYRKQREIRKHSHNKLANYILSLGNDIKVETMDFVELQVRNSTISKNTGKIIKNKKFGKSLENKAPAMLLTILDTKLKWSNTQLNKVNTYKVKASQYNHIKNTYIKKNLNERWNNFGEFKIQRDLYSEFLIMNVNDDLETINRDLCFEKFQEFKILHDIEIDRLRGLKENKIIKILI